MINFIIIRHGESVENLNNIIQDGNNKKNILTSVGKKQANHFIYTEKNNLNISKIISSPLKRAIQTSKIIAHELDVQIYIDNSIVEFDAGILKGLSHKYARAKYIEEYKIWNNRGDLDGIKDAERGDSLQARVLFFIESFISKEDNYCYSDYLIVSHVGFIRCLINTILFKDRRTPINIAHCYPHKIANIFQKLHLEKIYQNDKSEIIKVRTFEDDYIIKRIYNEDNFKNKYQEKISKLIKFDNISKIIYSGRKKSELNNSNYFVQVMKYIQGTHLFPKQLTNKQIKLLFNNLNKMELELERISKDFIDDEVKNINDIFVNSLTKLKDKKIRKIGENILKDQNYKQLIKNKQNILVIYDTHKDNILFQEQSIFFIDLGGVIFAPKNFQIACLLTVYFLLNLQEEFYLKDFLPFLHKDLNITELKFYMTIRIFIGISYFQIQKEKRQLLFSEEEILNKYIKSLKLIENKL